MVWAEWHDLLVGWNVDELTAMAKLGMPEMKGGVGLRFAHQGVAAQLPRVRLRLAINLK